MRDYFGTMLENWDRKLGGKIFMTAYTVPLNGHIYKHFKGNYYYVIGHAHDADTNELVILYREVDPTNKPPGFVWARDLPSWSKPVKIGDKNVERFKHITFAEYSDIKKSKGA